MESCDAMKVFVTAVEEGIPAGAARRLKRSPTAISRALGLLEQHVGVEILHRATRSLKLSEAGQRYVEACRRVFRSGGGRHDRWYGAMLSSGNGDHLRTACSWPGSASADCRLLSPQVSGRLGPASDA